MPVNRFTLDQRIEVFWSRVEKTDGCWIWTGATNRSGSHPYGVMGWWDDNTKVTRTVHRMSYELAHGPIPSGQVVRHSCNNTLCVRPDHLLLGTQQENLDDMHRQGRARGNPYGRPR